MSFERAAGIICHPTSFPGRFGVGDLGQYAYAFIDWLEAGRQRLWQVLPLGPTGYGDSPYQSFSAFAGNPLLISPEILAQEGLLPPDALEVVPPFPTTRADYGWVIPHKQKLFRRSYKHFTDTAGESRRREFQRFRERNRRWLADYGLFMAIKAHFGGGSWQDWPRAVRLREHDAMAALQPVSAGEAVYHEYLQWCFSCQWDALRLYAAEKDIQIVGDIPIFVAEDSADVWAHPEAFRLDENGRPDVVAGVPPDNFSATGQRWGNPHYDWECMAESGYEWWIERIRSTLELVDILRIDHFRGFEAAWEVPAAEPTAMVGQWVKGPGAALFEAVEAKLGRLPIIAEDLGVITPEVDALRMQFSLPGMKILQFGFALDTDAKYLTHSFERDFVVYPGTHDNNTVLGWFREPGRSEEERLHCLRYLNSDAADLAWDFIRAAWGSVAKTALVLLQDVMSLGQEARMNFPSTAGGNWQWRYTEEMLAPALAGRLAELTVLYGRTPVSAKGERECPQVDAEKPPAPPSGPGRGQT